MTKATFLAASTRRVRTPTLIQMEAVECGAAALGIILGYHGRFVPLAVLRSECGVSRDGSKASNLVKAARKYGMIAKGFKKSLKSLQTLPPPYIVFWDFNHFLVVEGIESDRVYLNDPAIGPRTVSWQEFDAAYTGVVLTFQPRPDFQKKGEKPNLGKSLAKHLKNSRSALIFSLIAGLFLTFPRLLVPAFTQIFVDRLLPQIQESPTLTPDWLRPLILIMLVTAIIQGLLAKMRLKTLRLLLTKLSVTLSGQFLWHSLRLPIGFYAQRFSGELAERAASGQKIAEALSGHLATTAIDGMMMGFYALLMFSYDRFLTLLTVSFALLNFFALQWLSRSRTDASIALGQEHGKAVGVAIGGIQGIETIKASGLESDLFAKFAGYYTKAINSQQNLGLQAQLFNALPTLLGALATAAILVVGGFRVLDGYLSIGMLVAYQLLAKEFLDPVNELVNFGGMIQELQADLDRLDDVLNNPLDPAIVTPAIARAPVTVDSFRLQGYLELRDISFGYSRLEKPLIENFSLRVKPGQRIALVGGSGSGKSTLAKLICGLYEPWQGEILLDGTPRRELPRSVLANSLAMVEQEIFLFAGTIRDNLTLWDPSITEEDIIQAAGDAAIESTILGQPGGYDAPLSEGGSDLSGGQRQRLEIARALVRNPSLLVLDEATSALDAETEVIIDRRLRRRGCTCIVIAHRLSTIRDCDEIIVLDRGRVVGRGTHEQLRDSEGAYRRLLSSE
jgi:ATP-binding cassette, subfamily C, bacterial